MAALQEEEFALALLDLHAPRCTPAWISSPRSRAHTPHTEVILFTGHAGLDSAVQALRLGAYDYLVKADLRLADLQALVARALERRHLALEKPGTGGKHLQGPGRDCSTAGPGSWPRCGALPKPWPVPLTWDQLVRGLVNLIWESLPLEVLGLELQGPEGRVAPWRPIAAAWMSRRRPYRI